MSRYLDIFPLEGIVIGNDDISSGLGDSASKSLAYIMDLSENKECVFYKKIDMRSLISMNVCYII